MAIGVQTHDVMAMIAKQGVMGKREPGLTAFIGS